MPFEKWLRDTCHLKRNLKKWIESTIKVNAHIYLCLFCERRFLHANGNQLPSHAHFFLFSIWFLAFGERTKINPSWSDSMTPSNMNRSLSEPLDVAYQTAEGAQSSTNLNHDEHNKRSSPEFILINFGASWTFRNAKKEKGVRYNRVTRLIYGRSFSCVTDMMLFYCLRVH